MQPGLVTPRSSVEPRPSLLDGFADAYCERPGGLRYGRMDVEERERQLTGTRPKTMAVVLAGFSRFSPGELCPLEDLNPAHDGSDPR